VKVFRSFEEFPSSGRNKSGSPGSVFGVVVTSGNETLPKRVVVVLELLLCDDWFGWKVDSRNS
jgi:hypothetical protein